MGYRAKDGGIAPAPSTAVNSLLLTLELDGDAELAADHDQTELRFAYDGQKVWSYLSFPDPLEDYANSFALFFYDPERLRQLSPVRYDWMLRNVATDAR